MFCNYWSSEWINSDFIHFEFINNDFIHSKTIAWPTYWTLYGMNVSFLCDRLNSTSGYGPGPQRIYKKTWWTYTPQNWQLAPWKIVFGIVSLLCLSPGLFLVSTFASFPGGVFLRIICNVIEKQVDLTLQRRDKKSVTSKSRRVQQKITNPTWKSTQRSN